MLSDTPHLWSVGARLHVAPGRIRLKRWLLAVAVSILPSAAFPQVFVSQGPAPGFGPLPLSISGDQPPSGPGLPRNGSTAGAINAVGADPSDPNTIYVGAVNGGVWVTHNGGMSWTPLTDQLTSLSISSLALDPADPTHKTWIAGTGLLSAGSLGTGPPSSFNSGTPSFFINSGGLRTGLLMSTDGGNTWAAPSGNATVAGVTIVNVEARGPLILAAGFEPLATARSNDPIAAQNGALYRSTDGGQTFTVGAPGLPPGPVSSLVGDPSNPAKFYAAVTSTTIPTATSLYVSLDSGASWSPVFTSATPVAGGNVIASATGQVFARASAGPQGSVAMTTIDVSTGKINALYLSLNSGQTWTRLALPSDLNMNEQAANNAHVAIDPSNPAIVYITGDTIGAPSFTASAYRVQLRPDGSSFFQPLTGNFFTADGSTIHADSRSMAFDATGRLILVNDGGIYARTSPQTTTGVWTGLNGNLSAWQMYGIAYDANSKRLLVAAQDTGSALQSAPGSALYNNLTPGDGTVAVINDRTLNQKSAIYSASEHLNHLNRTIIDAQGNPLGAHPTVLITFDTTPVNVDNTFRAPFVLNRVDPTRMAFASDHVFISQDPLNNLDSAQPCAGDVVSQYCITLHLTDLGQIGTTGQVFSLAYGANDNPGALLAGVDNGPGQRLFLSTAATPAPGTLNALPQYVGLLPLSLVFDPRTQARFFVADSVNLWSTQNGTAAPATVTFQNLTSNLPAGFIRPYAVEFISNNGVDALLVGGLSNVANAQSPITVADSDANGNLANWRLFGTGLPNAPVSKLAYNPTVDALAVATFGRGAWLLYDLTSNFPQATVLQFGLADNNSNPSASILTDGTALDGSHFVRPLIKYGTGTLTIPGDAAYTGGTTILGGALQLGNGGTSGSILGNVAFCSDAGNPLCDPSTDKMLVFNRSDTYTFNGAISGPGQVVQFGSGETILTAVNTYSGPTYVNAGTLSVNGSIASSPVFVNVGGTLGGNGTVGPTTILAGGTLSPGNSVGTLTVSGNLVFAAASSYMVEVQGNTADRTNASGTATLAGTVGMVNLGDIPTRSYTILSAAGGRIGTFDSVAAVNLPAFLTASLAYTPTDVQLTLTSGIGQIAGLTLNQSAVAAALDTSFNAGGGTLPGLLGLSAVQLPAAMDALSGEGVSATQETAFGAAGLFTSIMMDQGAFWRNGETVDVNGVAFAGEPLQYAPSKKSKTADHPAFKEMAPPPPYQPRWRAWLTGFDGTAKLDGEAGIGSATLSHNTGGLAAGLDYQFTPDLLAGFAIGGSSSNFSVRDRITSGHLEGAHFGGYAVKTWGALYTAGALSFGTFRNSETRSIAGIGPTETATGSFGSNLLSGRVEVGAKEVFGRFAVTPFAAAQFAELWQNAFTETNPVPAGAAGPLGLSYGSISVSSLPTFLGAQFDTRFAFSNGMALSPYARLSWVHEFFPTRSINPTFIALPGAAFTVDGPRATNDAARIDAGAKLAIGPNSWLFASFDGEFSGRGQSYAGKGGVRIAW